MGQELQSWRSEKGSRLWLSTLIDAMEDHRDPQCSSQSDAISTLEELHLQLSLPASLHSYPTSIFSFNN